MVSFQTTTLTVIFVILAGEIYAQESVSPKFLLIKVKGIMDAIGKTNYIWLTQSNTLSLFAAM